MISEAIYVIGIEHQLSHVVLSLRNWFVSITLSERIGLLTLVVGIIAVIGALIIGFRQLKISRIQNAIAKYQGALGALSILKDSHAPEDDIKEALDILQGLSDNLEKIDK